MVSGEVARKTLVRGTYGELLESLPVPTILGRGHRVRGVKDLLDEGVEPGELFLLGQDGEWRGDGGGS